MPRGSFSRGRHTAQWLQSRCLQSFRLSSPTDLGNLILMKRLPWLMLWKDARTDLKLRQLSDAEFRCWFNLLCFAGDEDQPGLISEAEEDLLAIEVSGGDIKILRSTLASLQRLKIVDVTPCNTPESVTGVTRVTVQFCSWEKRQQRKPGNTPERVRARVAKHRAAKASGNGQKSVTPVTPCNTREERRIEDKEYPPAPQKNAGCNGSASTQKTPQKAEPDFAPMIPMGLGVPPDIERVAKLAEELFPLMEFGRRAETDARSHGAAIVERALREASKTVEASGQRVGWKYIQGIITRIERDVRDPPSRSRRLSAAPPPPERPVHVAPKDSPFRHFSQERD